MAPRFLSLALGFFILLTFSCRKEDMQQTNCDKLQQALLAGNPDEVEAEINSICASLGATENSEEGINILSSAVSTKCHVNAVTVCFNCIKTLPEESEIKLSVSTLNGHKDKIIDIARSGDKFVFAGMHD